MKSILEEEDGESEREREREVMVSGNTLMGERFENKSSFLQKCED